MFNQINSALVFPDLINPNFGLPDSKSGRQTNKFRRQASRVLPQMPDWWLPTLVNTVFCQVSVNNSAAISKQFGHRPRITSFLNPVNSVNAL